MSPTEDDLRSALADGGGDVPNVDHIVFAAKERRVQRRKRVLSVAAAVVLVGALGTGGTYLAQHGSSTESADSGGAGSAGSGDSGDRAADGAATPAPSRPSSAAGTTGSDTGVACPAHTSTTDLPGGGGTGQFGSTGPMFAEPVGTVTVCAYVTATAPGPPEHVRLTGSDATTFAASLEHAARTRSNRACPDYRMADQKTLEVIATTASGKRLATVMTTIDEPSCAVVVTNGTAVRYGWAWPTSLNSELSQLGGGTYAPISGSGTPDR